MRQIILIGFVSFCSFSATRAADFKANVVPVEHPYVQVETLPVELEFIRETTKTQSSSDVRIQQLGDSTSDTLTLSNSFESHTSIKRTVAKAAAADWVYEKDRGSLKLTMSAKSVEETERLRKSSLKDERVRVFTSSSKQDMTLQQLETREAVIKPDSGRIRSGLKILNPFDRTLSVKIGISISRIDDAGNAVQSVAAGYIKEAPSISGDIAGSERVEFDAAGDWIEIAPSRVNGALLKAISIPIPTDLVDRWIRNQSRFVVTVTNLVVKETSTSSGNSPEYRVFDLLAQRLNTGAEVVVIDRQGSIRRFSVRPTNGVSLMDVLGVVDPKIRFRASDAKEAKGVQLVDSFLAERSTAAFDVTRPQEMLDLDRRKGAWVYTASRDVSLGDPIKPGDRFSVIFLTIADVLSASLRHIEETSSMSSACETRDATYVLSSFLLPPDSVVDVTVRGKIDRLVQKSLSRSELTRGLPVGHFLVYQMEPTYFLLTSTAESRPLSIRPDELTVLVGARSVSLALSEMIPRDIASVTRTLGEETQIRFKVPDIGRDADGLVRGTLVYKPSGENLKIGRKAVGFNCNEEISATRARCIRLRPALDVWAAELPLLEGPVNAPRTMDVSTIHSSAWRPYTSKSMQRQPVNFSPSVPLCNPSTDIFGTCLNVSTGDPVSSVKGSASDAKNKSYCSYDGRP